MSIKIKPIMELSLFAIIVLLVVILYMQSDRFAKLNSEINAVKRRLDLLLEKKKEISSISETKVPPVLMENTEEEPSLPTPVKDKIQSVSEVQLPENGTEAILNLNQFLGFLKRFLLFIHRLLKQRNRKKKQRNRLLYLLKRRRRRLIMKSSSARIFLERLVFLF